MLDATDLVNMIKSAATEAVGTSQPAGVFFGKVIQAEPLQILVEQKMTLGSMQLVLTRNVTDYTIMASIDWETEKFEESSSGDTEGETKASGEPEHTHKFANASSGSSPHDHTVKGRKKITLHNSLAAGEEVILFRQQGGQKYIVLDRIGS